jgi:hypothetical protein
MMGHRDLFMPNRDAHLTRLHRNDCQARLANHDGTTEKLQTHNMGSLWSPTLKESGKAKLRSRLSIESIVFFGVGAIRLRRTTPF